MDFGEAINRTQKMLALYHKLARTPYGSEWTIEQDALAFPTDAGLVGWLAISHQGCWPKGKETLPELDHKAGECMWWLIVLAERMEIDIQEATEKFSTKWRNFREID